jgi:hypothetical protein
LDDPLLGFDPPTRYVPKSPPEASRPAGTSLGVSCPSSALGEGSPRPAGFPTGLPVLPGSLPAGPTPPATVPLAGFPNLAAAFFLPPPSCRFQAGGAPGVPPFRGLFRSRSPDGSSPPACPLDVAPRWLAFPHPRRGYLGARQPENLGTLASAFPRLQGLRPRESQSLPPGHD